MVMRVYVPDPTTDPQGGFAPVGVNFSLAEAIDESRKGLLVLWTPRCEVFGMGFKVPGAYSDFYLNGQMIRNPWAFFRPLPSATPEFVDDGLGDITPLRLMEIAETLFDEYSLDDPGKPD